MVADVGGGFGALLALRVSVVWGLAGAAGWYFLVVSRDPGNGFSRRLLIGRPGIAYPVDITDWKRKGSRAD